MTQQPGDWNTASTWAGGTIPGENDTVWITESVTFSTSITVQYIYIFPGGSLSVDETGATMPNPGTASFERMILYRVLNDIRRINLDGIRLDPDRVVPELSCGKQTVDSDSFPLTSALADEGDGKVIIDDPGFISSSAILRDIKPEGCTPAYAEKVSNAVRYITVTIHIKATDMRPLISLYRMAKGPFQVLLVTRTCVIKGFIESVVPDPASVGKEYITVKVTVTEGPGA
ncbi:MAG: hypothetical protein IJI97_00360 [Clostridia bacterium]|nr:hypothetical protein [Clostridia bacterium]